MFCQAGFDQWQTTIMHASVPFEQAPSDRVGAVEPGHGAGALVCRERRGDDPGRLAGAQGEHRPPAIAGVLLPGQRQGRHPSAGRARRGLLRAAAALGADRVAAAPNWPWPWMPPPGRTALWCWSSASSIAGVLSRWRGWPAGRAEARLARRVAAPVTGGAAGGLARMDGTGAGRPRPVCSVAVPGHRPLGLAPLPARYHEGAHSPQRAERASRRWAASRRPSARGGRPGAPPSPPIHQLDCTLLAYGAEGCTEPWRILTDLPPAVAEAG